MPRVRLALLALALAGAPAIAQDVVELGGRVVGADGTPLPRARVEIRWLEVPESVGSGRRGRYRLAERAALAASRPPRTITDDDGRWRLMIPPQQAAWLTVGLATLGLSVTADGHEPWLRAVADVRALPDTARLIATPPGDPLVVRLHGSTPPWRGFAVVARSFRVSPTRTIWLRERVELDPSGELRFGAPPTVAGEVPPDGPTARVDGYRLTVWALDRDVVQLDLAPGEHTVEVPPAPWRPRPVLGERAAAVPTPIEATWRIEDQSLKLNLDTARVPLLGGEPPVAARCPAGAIEIDAWDPDQPLFLVHAADRDEPDDQAAAATVTAEASLAIDVVDASGAAVIGAGVLVEDLAAESATGAPFASTDARGHAVLRGLPRGDWRVLVHRSGIGEREALLAAHPGGGESVRVQLAALPPVPATPTGLPGAVRIALPGAPSEVGFTEVGTLAPDGRLVRRRFPGHPGMVLLEGLVQGPVTVYARRDDRPPVIWASHLAGTRDDPPMAFDAVPARTFVLVVRDSSGAAVAGDLLVSLPEKPGRFRQSAETTDLFHATPVPGEAGRYTLEARLDGAAWLRIVGPGGGAADIALPGEGSGLVEVALAAPPPPPDDNATSPPPVDTPR